MGGGVSVSGDHDNSQRVPSDEEYEDIIVHLINRFKEDVDTLQQKYEGLREAEVVKRIVSCRELNSTVKKIEITDLPGLRGQSLVEGCVYVLGNSFMGTRGADALLSLVKEEVQTEGDDQQPCSSIQDELKQIKKESNLQETQSLREESGVEATHTLPKKELNRTSILYKDCEHMMKLNPTTREELEQIKEKPRAKALDVLGDEELQSKARDILPSHTVVNPKALEMLGSTKITKKKALSRLGSDMSNAMRSRQLKAEKREEQAAKNIQRLDK